MRVSDLTVEVRDSSLARVGQILPADLVGLELALRLNKVGAWRISLRSDHPLVDVLRAPGSGLIVTGPAGILISGPTVNAVESRSTDDPRGTWEILGTDDSVVLGERLAYPVPSSALLSGQTSAYDVRTGKAETVAKAFVNANIGPSAPAARRVTGLSVDTDLARGVTVTASARFDRLGEFLTGILATSGLAFDVVQSGSSLLFRVFEPVDRSAVIRMDVDNLRLTRSEYTYTAPGATRVIVAGQGEGAERTLIERTSSESLSAESAWGRRIEVFKDQRNTDVLAELQKAGDEVLAEQGKTVVGIKVTPSDDIASMRYGIDWGLGDRVTVVVGDAEVVQVVTEAAVVVDVDGVRVGATVGDPVVVASSGDAFSSVVATQSVQDSRISNLERNELSSGGGGGASVTVADTAPANPADGSLWVRSTDMTIFIRYNDGDSVQWVEVKKADDQALATRTLALETSTTSLASRATALETAEASTNKSGLVPVIPSSLSLGSGSAAVNSNGLITFTGVSSLSLNSVFSSTYRNYRMVIEVPTVSAASSTLALQFRSGTTNNAGNFYFQYWLMHRLTGVTQANSGGPNTNYSLVGMTANTNSIFRWSGDIFTPQLTAQKVVQGIGLGADATSTYQVTSTVLYNAVASFDGITLFPSTGTMTGTVQIFGYRS